MGRTPSWHNPVMQNVRVPSVFADILRRLAKEMDGLGADEELTFICTMKNVEALQSQDFLEAAEVALKVTSKSLLTDEEPQENELDLSMLVNQDFKAARSDEAERPEAEAFDADTIIDLINDTFWLNETEPVALEPQHLEDAACDIDHWHQAIGDVSLTANDAVPVPVVAQSETLLDLAELSTLFAVKTEPESEPELAFDPDAVIESVQAKSNEPDSSLLAEGESFDPDAVIESLEAEQSSDLIACDTMPKAMEAETETVKSLEVTSATAVVTASEPTVEVEPLPPCIAVPQLAQISVNVFAEQLFTAWRQLAIQKLRQQKRSQAQPWGVAIELNDLYRTQFTNMIGSHFLKRVQEAVLAKIPGKEIQLIAIPGVVNLTIAGVDASAISYEADSQPQLSETATQIWIQKPNNAEVRTISPALTPSVSNPVAYRTFSGTEATTPQTQPSTPTLNDDLAQLLNERHRRVAGQSDGGNWFQRWFKS